MSYLDLSNNQIDGVIPSWIWVNWKDSISVLYLSHNMFTSLENSPSVVHMNNLKFLDFSSNKLHGSVPIPLTTGSQLFLDYSNNSFSSIIPDFGRYLPSGTNYLDLSRNNLSGHIPRSLCTQQYLEILDLSYKNFSGVVPSCLMQGSMIWLTTLKLRENHFHGMLPENIGEGCALQTIDLNNNRIEGKIPRSLSNCQQLELLDVGNNQIVGSFPSWLGVLPQLRVLVLRSNQLNGTIRDIKGDHTVRNYTVRNYFGSLQILDLASNNFYGNLPKGWFNELKAMMENVSDEGQVLGHETNSREGFYRDTVTITFKGFGLSFTKILSTFKVIDFSNNSFGGHVPESIGRLVSLRGLNMSYNNFTGQIPFQYRNLSQLESMDLSWNQITGGIPHELTSLTSLEWLNLSYNNLYGRIPQGNQFSTFSDSSFEGNAGLCGVPLSKHCDNQSSISPTGVALPESEGLWQDKLGVILLFAFVGLGFGVGFALSFLLRLYCRMEGWICKQA
ncbi:hypothetical protein CFC21_040102 [Triticum aestivum]|uniref:Leucine-rich repeat-containing N-terminal plant-type domain-containing protein n=2 Tax=Triticum aestivum TaxID=4565 RepID=A0A9R1FGG6_WHEAT|nr:hypothetical protein CFC21_040102 [Triticum aestivum]